MLATADQTTLRSSCSSLFNLISDALQRIAIPFAEHLRLAASWSTQPGNDAQQGAFPGAILPAQNIEPSRFQFQ
jgi:hypothetical protein